MMIDLKKIFCRTPFWQCQEDFSDEGSRFGLAAEPGFTMLEILIAILIFSIVVTTIFGSFGAVFSSSETITSSTDRFDMARNCLSRLQDDLESFYISLPPKYKKPDIDDEPDEFHIKGETTNVAGEDFGRLRFSSMAHVQFLHDMRQGIAEIIYYVMESEEEKTGLVLKRSDYLYPYPDFEESADHPTICENVLGLEFTYFDDEGNEEEDWDSESDDVKYASPRAVGIKLIVGDEEGAVTLSSRVALPVFREPME
jgi:general secretion pathway protein J